MTALTTQTPAEIDTALADLMYASYAAAMTVTVAETSVFYSADAKRNYYTKTWFMSLDEALTVLTDRAADETYRGTDAARTLTRYNEACEAVAVIEAQVVPLNAEFVRRGGWTRAFLAQAAGGHVHSSQNCGSCYPTTQYAWFTALSGHTEAEVIEKAGSDACTYCYPDAPVNDLKRPRSIFSDDEVAAQKDRAQRADDKAARQAKRIEKALTADGSEFRVQWVEVRGGHDRDADGRDTYVTRPRPASREFKTEQAAVQWVVQSIAWGHLNAGELDAIETVVSAVASKHGQSEEEVRAMVVAKVAAKRKRDAR